MQQSPAERRPSPVPSRCERGAGMVGYAGVTALVASIAVAVLAAGVPDRVGTLVGSAVCAIGAGAGCGASTARTAAGDQGSRTSPLPPDADEDDGPKCDGSWPNVVGLDAEEAKRVVQQEDPDLSVTVVPEGSVATMDFRCGRVRLHVDDDGTVISAPHVG